MHRVLPVNVGDREEKERIMHTLVNIRSSVSRASRGTHAAVAGLSLLLATCGVPRLGWAFGACCLGDNVCGEIARADCPSSAYWWGEGTDCDGVGHTGRPGGACDFGACCQRGTPSSPNGSCDYVTRRECDGLCGKYMLNTSTCSDFQGSSCDDAFVNDPLACDCNNDGETYVEEILTAVGLALDCIPGVPCCINPFYYPDGSYVCGEVIVASPCPAADQDRNGRVTINELVLGVRAALGMCNG